MNTRTTIPMTPASPGAITSFARLHNALAARDYRGAKRFRQELRAFGYSVCPIEPASARRPTRVDEMKDAAVPGNTAAPRFRGQRTATTPPRDRDLTNTLR